jgi:hypothetical protein
MQRIIQDRQIIVLPSFAWAEVGIVLRKKRRTIELEPLTRKDAKEF